MHCATGLLVLGLQGCQETASTGPVPQERLPVPLARQSIPNNLGSTGPWNRYAQTTISYALSGDYAKYDKYHKMAQEAFREWSLVLSDAQQLIRFVEITDQENANILVSSGSTFQGGCAEDGTSRYCNLVLPTYSYLLKSIGLAMGIPTSSGVDDVMNTPSIASIFTPEDLASVRSVYGNTAGWAIPIMEASFYGRAGTEIVIDWESLRNRAKPGPIYVKRTLLDRTTIAGALGGFTDRWEYSVTYPMLTYKLGSGGSYYLTHWPYRNADYANSYSVRDRPTVQTGLTGGDPAPGVLGYPTYPVAGLVPAEASFSLDDYNKGAKLFAFDPSLVTLSKTLYAGMRASAPSAAFGKPGQTIPVWFYKDLSTGLFRVSGTIQTGNVGGLRQGGWGIAVQ